MTTALVRIYGAIAVDDLRIGNMTRSAKGSVEEPTRRGHEAGTEPAHPRSELGLILAQLASGSGACLQREVSETLQSASRTPTPTRFATGAVRRACGTA